MPDEGSEKGSGSPWPCSWVRTRIVFPRETRTKGLLAEKAAPGVHGSARVHSTWGSGRHVVRLQGSFHGQGCIQVTWALSPGG